MTTRTKLALCAGLLAVAVGVAVVCAPMRKPPLEVRFVCYTNTQAFFDELPWGALLALTNHGATAFALDCDSPSVMLLDLRPNPRFPSPGHYGTGLLALPETPATTLPPTIIFRYSPQSSSSNRSPIRLRVERLLQKLGVTFAHTGTVITVTIPPRGSNTAAQPVTP